MLIILAALASSVHLTTSVQPPIPPVVEPIVRLVPTAPTEALARGIPKMTPEEAVMKAAAAFPRMVFGVFEFRVRRAEQVGPNFFINSEEDYRDQRDLSVRILPPVVARLHERFGKDLSKALLGHNVRVMGPAVRVRIDFLDDGGKPSGKYYYQTHVPVIDAREIELAD